MLEDNEDSAKINSTHFGDKSFDIEAAKFDPNDISWNEVFRAMCCHTPQGWAENFIGLGIILFFLYFFLVALELMGSSAKSLTGCLSSSLFGDTNPIAGVVIGIISTVLLQSSSTTTSIIVSLVSAGLDTEAAIYMVMGANIGTSVTNTIVSIGQMGDGDQLERAFAGATVHDMFNCLTVLILLPVEVTVHYLYRITKLMTPDEVSKGETWTSPFKEITDPIVKRVIVSNSKLLKDVALGKTTCEDYYPVFCNGTGASTYDNCVKKGSVGLISCDEDFGCPAFFRNNSDQDADQLSAGFVLFLSLVMLCIALIGLVWILQKMLMGASERVIFKATSVNGYISILIGTLLTMAVQSSSVTTSTLTPLVGLGVIPLEQVCVFVNQFFSTSSPGSKFFSRLSFLHPDVSIYPRSQHWYHSDWPSCCVELWFCQLPPSCPLSFVFQYYWYHYLLANSIYASNSFECCQVAWKIHSHLERIPFFVYCCGVCYYSHYSLGIVLPLVKC